MKKFSRRMIFSIITALTALNWYVKAVTGSPYRYKGANGVLLKN